MLVYSNFLSALGWTSIDTSQVLPMFSKQLIDYTESTFKEEAITIRTGTMVKSVTDKYIEAQVTKPDGSKEIEKIPYGLLVWATGNAVRDVVRDLMNQIPAQKKSRRGLAVNEYLVVNGTENIWAVGDCAITNYAPTAQVASQEGAFLARLFNTMAKTDNIEKELSQLSVAQSEAKDDTDRNKVLDEIRALQQQLRRTRQVGPFQYSHQGSLAYIGKERAVADISWLSGNIASGGTLTYLFWRSAYLSMCFSSKSSPLYFIILKLQIWTDSLIHSTQPCPRGRWLAQGETLRPWCLPRINVPFPPGSGSFPWLRRETV